MSTNYSTLLGFLASIGFILFLACVDAKADQVTIVKNDNHLNHYELELKHGAINDPSSDRNSTQVIDLGPHWTGTIKIEQADKGVAGDILKITIKVQHLTDGPQNHFVFDIDAGAFDPGDNKVCSQGPCAHVGSAHGDSFDFYLHTLTFTVSFTGDRADITNYRLTSTADHPVPEPTSLTMAGMASLGLFVYRRWAKARRKGEG